jgi:hypothetical protein
MECCSRTQQHCKKTSLLTEWTMTMLSVVLELNTARSMLLVWIMTIWIFLGLIEWINNDDVECFSRTQSWKKCGDYDDDEVKCRFRTQLLNYGVDKDQVKYRSSTNGVDNDNEELVFSNELRTHVTINKLCNMIIW